LSSAREDGQVVTIVGQTELQVQEVQPCAQAGTNFLTSIFYFFFNFRLVLSIFLCFLQHCFICHPSVGVYNGFEPRLLQSWTNH
jgi:hypothetical protein